MNDLKVFRPNPSQLKKWLRQNKVEDFIDCSEGVLLDNLVVQCKRGIAALYEHYVNSNQSDYLVEYQHGDGAAVLSNWDKRRPPELA